MLYTEHMHTDPAYRERLRACGLDSVDKVLTRIEGGIAAWSRTTDSLHIPGTGGLPGFYVKRYLFPSWVKRWRGTFRGTFFGMHRGQAEFRALNALRSAGVPAVRPVAYGSRRVAHFVCACFLITEEVPGAENLTSFALSVKDGRRRLARGQRLALIRSLASQLAAMHATGCVHGNLFWRNLLVRDGPDGSPEFFFLDARPPRSWQRVGAGGNWWQRELAQLEASARPFASRTERLRFLHHYLGVTRLDPVLKTQVRQIERLAETWRRHEERRIHMSRLFESWSQHLAQETRPSCAGGASAECAEPAL